MNDPPQFRLYLAEFHGFGVVVDTAGAFRRQALHTGAHERIECRQREHTMSSRGPTKNLAAAGKVSFWLHESVAVDTIQPLYEHGSPLASAVSAPALSSARRPAAPRL
jgi:hypothetical protein